MPSRADTPSEGGAPQRELDTLQASLLAAQEETARLKRERAEALVAVEREAMKDVDRALDALRRALPDLDETEKTAQELRASVRKTMDRADVVSVKVRSLDAARSRAISALALVDAASELARCARSLSEALSKHELETAADYVKRYDSALKSIQDMGGEEALVWATNRVPNVQDARAELERQVGEKLEQASKQGMVDVAHASALTWLDVPVCKEFARHASVMMKVGRGAAGVDRYAGFLKTAIKERAAATLIKGGSETSSPTDACFVDGVKSIVNDCASAIDSATRREDWDPVFKTRLALALFQGCDAEIVAVLDAFMASRRLHARASTSLDVHSDLHRVNQILVETCFLLQHVETYDRFVASRVHAASLISPSDALSATDNSEHRRTSQEVAGVYALLERGWIAESLNRAVKAEQLMEGKYTSLGEDPFYVARKAVKRALSTGSPDAACGCINVLVACLEDALLAIFSHRVLSSETNQQLLVALATIEVAGDNAQKLYAFVSGSAETIVQRDVAKLTSCAEGLLDLRLKFDSLRWQGVDKLARSVLSKVHAGPVWQQAAAESSGLTYDLDEAAYERDAWAHFPVSVAAALKQQLTPPKVALGESSSNFNRLIVKVAHGVAEAMEKLILSKPRVSQLGALRFERDVRALSAALVDVQQDAASHSRPTQAIKAQFARLLQMASLLGVSDLLEIHDVWELMSRAHANATNPGSDADAVQPRERLSAKDVKRVLGFRSDFDLKEVQRLKIG